MPLFLTAFAFFLSGFAALVYQIVWQRLLVLPLGADIYSTTITVAAFMTGLGVGSLAGGHVADRLTPTRNLQLFVFAELAVGLFGLASRGVFYDWQYLTLGSLALPQTVTIASVFVTLLWPTFWMGMSLPVLGRAISRGVSGAAVRVGILYGLNTLGAAAGAFVSTWIVVPRLGFDGALRVAAGLNLVAAGCVLLILGPLQAPLQRAIAGTRPDGAADDTGIEGTGWTFRTWAWLYALAGFQALSLEILWFRLLGVMVKASAFTFGTLLTIYLAGLGVGTAVASAGLSRVRRPALAFLSLQAFVGLYAGVSLAALVALLEADALPGFSAYFASYEPLDAAAAFRQLQQPGEPGNHWRFIALYFVLPMILVGPPTIALGASFPLLQKIVLVDLAHVGRRVGTILLANIAGSAVGSIVTGWLALTWLGSGHSLRLLAIVSGGFLALAVVVATIGRRVRWRAIVLTAAAALVVAVALRVPAGSRLWARLHGSLPRWVVYGEDATGLSLVRAERSVFGSSATVFVNGIGQSWIPYGNVHTVLGALPAFVHPAPRSAALIGLGSGDTLYAIAGRQELADITSIEIIRPQTATLREWERLSGYPGLKSIFSDPRITHVYGDGRIHVMRAGRRFDIIEADALRPTSAYSGNLHSVGYFELIRSRLTDGGFAVTWSPTSRIHDTFVSVFPHVLSFGDGSIVIGSRTPIAFDAAAIRERLRAPAVREHYKRAHIDIDALLEPLLEPAPRTVLGGRPVASDDLDEDLFPRDEFSVERRR